MSRYLIAPSPKPVTVTVRDDPPPRVKTKPDGRRVRIVPVTPRCRFGDNEEREVIAHAFSRIPLPPIPEHLITRLPPGKPPGRRFELPPEVRIGKGFDAEQPTRGQLDPLALATASLLTPMGVEVMYGLFNDAPAPHTQRKKANKAPAPVPPPPRLTVIGQLIALAAQLRLKLAPNNDAVTSAARDAIRLIGYRRAEVTSVARARELGQRTSDYLRLRRVVESVLRTLYIEGRTVYQAIASKADRQTDHERDHFARCEHTMKPQTMRLDDADRARIDRLTKATERTAERLEMLLAYESRPRSPGVLRLHPGPPEPHDHKPH